MHLGVVVGTASFLAAAWLGLARSPGEEYRRVARVGAVAAVVLAVGLGAAVLRTQQWGDAASAILAEPVSVAWLGEGLRLETNRMALFMVGDRPLGGYGIGGFEAARSPPTTSATARWSVVGGTRLLNHPLHMQVDFGVVGLATNLWMVGAFVIPGIRVVRHTLKANRAGPDLVTVGCLAGAGSLLFLSIWTGEWLYDAAISVPAFMLLAATGTGVGPIRAFASSWTVATPAAAHAILFALGL